MRRRLHRGGTAEQREHVLAAGELPRVLMLMPGSDDYVGDALLHGLRELLDERVVDVPRADQLYSGRPEAERARRYGRGFTLYSGLLDELEIDRTWVAERVASGEFDLVVISDVWRRAGALVDLMPRLTGPPQQLAVIDGADSQMMYPYAPSWWIRPGGLTLPRAHRRGLYFKRELTPQTARWRTFGLVPGRVARALGATRGLRPVAIAIPAQQVMTDDELATERPQRFQRHIVDPEVAERVGASVDKPFAEQSAYEADLRASRFGVTVRRAGWDALRHYEIAAAGAIPCFRDLDLKPSTCAPHGLIDGANCISYSSADELLARIDRLEDEDERRLREGAVAWAREHTTRAEAARFLTECGWPLSSAP